VPRVDNPRALSSAISPQRPGRKSSAFRGLAPWHRWVSLKVGPSTTASSTSERDRTTAPPDTEEIWSLWAWRDPVCPYHLMRVSGVDTVAFCAICASQLGFALLLAIPVVGMCSRSGSLQHVGLGREENHRLPEPATIRCTLSVLSRLLATAHQKQHT